MGIGRDVPQPEERSPSLAWDAAREAFFRPVGRLTHPGRLVRRVGTLFGGDHVPPAANVNALDEVPNSTWFTNRIGLYPTAPEKAAQGPGQGVGPDRSDPWTVISAKTEGLSTGFNIRDAKGERYLIKFDPPGLTGTAGVITGRILHAAGYNVPDDNVVFFRREDVRVGDGVLLTEEDGTERSMSEADLDDLLARVDRPADGTWRAISSRFLPGVPLGPSNGSAAGRTIQTIGSATKTGVSCEVCESSRPGFATTTPSSSIPSIPTSRKMSGASFGIISSISQARWVWVQPGCHRSVASSTMSISSRCWAELTDTRLDLANASSSDLLRRAPEDPFGFVAVELQVHRGDRWSAAVTAYLSRGTNRVVAVGR